MEKEHTPDGEPERAAVSLSTSLSVSDKDQPKEKDDEQADVVVADGDTASSGSFKDFIRIFKYADTLGVLLNIVGIICSIGSGTILPLMTIIFGSSITSVNNFSSGGSATAVFQHKILIDVYRFIYLFVARLCLSYVGNLSLSISAVRTTRALREAYLEKMMRREIWYFDGTASGSIAIQVTTNGNRINKGIADQLSTFFQAMSQFVSAFVVALAIQWKLALITLSVIPAMFVIAMVGIAFDARIEAKVIDIYSKAGRIAEEAFASIRTIHAFWAHSKMVENFNTYLLEAKRVSRPRNYIYGALFPSQFFCVYSGIALAYWQGFKMFQEGEVPNAGHVFTVVFSVVIAATSVSALLPLFQTFANAAASASELFKALDQPSLLDPFDSNGQVPSSCTGEIQVQDLTFAYPSRPAAKILKGLTLSVPAGKTTALVGASGCGKSTLIGLLERWYQRKSGSITLDGVDITDLNTHWLRSQIRLVQQEPVLFQGTVFENVQNGFVGSQRDLPLDEQMKMVEEACKASNAHDFIESLPQGYQTFLGERGGLLSGGQRQRIAIARSIVSNPKILLLDEATSALDPRAERVVQQALDKVSAHRTTLLIAHKLATVKNADSIAVIDKGVVAEQGTHNELMEKNGIYARLVRAQDLGDAEGATEKSKDMELEEENEDDDIVMDRRPSGLAREQSHADSRIVESEEQVATNFTTKSMGYSLIRCIWIVMREADGLRFQMAFSAFGSCLGAGIYPAQAILFSKLLNVFTLHGSDAKSKADLYSLLFFVLALVALVGYFIVGYSANVIISEVSRKYRRELFENTLRQDISFFDVQENTAGALTSTTFALPNQLQELLGANIFLILIIFVSILSTSILAIAYGWKLGLTLVFAGLTPLMLAGYARIRLESSLEDKTAAMFAESAGVANEAIVGIRTVSSLTLEEEIAGRYAKMMSKITTVSIRTFAWTLFWYALSQSLDFLVLALGFWYGSQLLIEGEYTLSQFYVIFIGTVLAGQNAAQLFGYTTSITKARAAANYLFWLRQQIPVVKEDDSNRDSGPSKDDASIELVDLNFRYPSRTTLALNGIRLKISSGQFAAFVGPSGCGKSTMINLLERFYEPSSGEVRFANGSLSNYSPRLYRKDVSLVQQEPTLFSGTVRDNIMLGEEAEIGENGDLGKSAAEIDEMVLNACRSSNAYDFIKSLPEGLSTPCGSRGLQFSGGQKQRIAIARALIRQPRLLLLDEATSALDTESERIVQDALNQAKEGRTTIAVAHRLSTIKHADVIFVFGNGRIVEQGTHAQLLALKGRYYDMCQAQSLDKSV